MPDCYLRNLAERLTVAKPKVIRIHSTSGLTPPALPPPPSSTHMTNPSLSFMAQSNNQQTSSQYQRPPPPAPSTSASVPRLGPDEAALSAAFKQCFRLLNDYNLPPPPHISNGFCGTSPTSTSEHHAQSPTDLGGRYCHSLVTFGFGSSCARLVEQCSGTPNQWCPTFNFHRFCSRISVYHRREKQKGKKAVSDFCLLFLFTAYFAPDFVQHAPSSYYHADRYLSTRMVSCFRICK